MKAQLGMVLLGMAVFVATPAWSQIGSVDAPVGSVYGPPIGSVDSLQIGSQDPSQGGSSDSGQSSNGPQPAYTNPEQLPPLALLGEVTAETGLRIGLSTGAYYDTSAGFSAKPQPVTYFLLTPTISIRQIRPTLNWSLGYSGGLSLNSATSTNSTYISNSAVADILDQLSTRWQLHVHDGFTYSNDPFTPYLTYTQDPTLNHPNPTIYTPLSVSESNHGLIELTHILTEHDSISFSGTESYFRNLYTNFVGYNNFSWGGRASYNHIFSARFSAGGGYNFNALDFAHGQTRSGTSMIIGYAEYLITPTMTISGWVGPEWTGTKDIVPQFCFMGQCFGYTTTHQHFWNMAYGTTFSWLGQRNAFQGAFSKQISDGGGLLGTVQLYMVNASYSRRLTPRLYMTAGMQYGNNHSTSLYYADRYIDSIVGSVNVRRQLSPSWSLGAGYTYLYETQKNIYPYPTWKDNRVGFRLQYLWGHSLGR